MVIVQQYLAEKRWFIPNMICHNLRLYICLYNLQSRDYPYKQAVVYCHGSSYCPYIILLLFIYFNPRVDAF